MTKIAADYDYDWKGQLEDLEDVEVEVKQKNKSASRGEGGEKKETVTSVFIRTDDGKRVDVDDTIDEAANMERQARKKEGSRRHGKGGNTEEMDASEAAGERKAQKVIGQEPISSGRGLHTTRTRRDLPVPLPIVGRVGLGRSFSTSAAPQAAGVQVNEQMYKLVTHKVAAYQEALKAVRTDDTRFLRTALIKSHPTTSYSNHPAPTKMSLSRSSSPGPSRKLSPWPWRGPNITTLSRFAHNCI